MSTSARGAQGENVPRSGCESGLAGKRFLCPIALQRVFSAGSRLSAPQPVGGENPALRQDRDIRRLEKQEVTLQPISAASSAAPSTSPAQGIPHDTHGVGRLE